MIKVHAPKGLGHELKDSKVQVEGKNVLFQKDGKTFVGVLEREVELQGLDVSVVVVQGQVYLKFELDEPVPSEPSELLTVSRERAYMEVPYLFKLELSLRLKPLYIFFEKDGTPKTNFLLRTIEEYYPRAKEGRFLAWWHLFKSARDKIALENINLVHSALRAMRVRPEEYEELYQDCMVEFLRAVGMWDPKKGKLSTLAISQLKAFLQKTFAKKDKFLSLDVPVSDRSKHSFADFVYDPRTWEEDAGLAVKAFVSENSLLSGFYK